jgi:hypothetical protein
VIWVALAALLVLALAVYSAGMVVRSLVRQQARERELLLNQIMHLSGRTWQQPPAPEAQAVDEDTVVMVDPSQLPDY